MCFRPVVLTLTMASCLGLAACSEKPQTIGKKTDAQAWDTPVNAYSAPGFKTGDQTAWETQIRKRTDGQNEYSRIVSAP